MRFTPHALRSAACFASWLPLVVSVSSVERPALEMARQRAQEPHDVLAHERLAAGDAQFLDAAGDESRAQAVELLERQEVALGQERHVLRHAVDAAEVAAVRHRHAQIGDVAAEGIDERTVRDCQRSWNMPTVRALWPLPYLSGMPGGSIVAKLSS